MPGPRDFTLLDPPLDPLLDPPAPARPQPESLDSGLSHRLGSHLIQVFLTVYGRT